MDIQKLIDEVNREAYRLRKKAEVLEVLARSIVKAFATDGVTTPEVKKRKISPAGLRAIRKATKARWARYRQQNKVIQMKKRA